MNELLTTLLSFHFLRPYWLFAVIPALLLILLLWYRKDSFGAWHRVISPQLLPHLLGDTVARRPKFPLILLACAWVIACIAIAGPTWKKLPLPAQKKVHARVIVLDLSQSMYAKDLTPSRLVRARMKLSDILDRSKEGITALVVYSGTPHIVTPLTDDTNTILSMINSLNPEIMPVQGSNPIAAIQQAKDMLKNGSNGVGQILLITDNIPNNFVEKLTPILNADIQLSILGVGTKQGAPIERADGSFVKNANGTIVIPKLHATAMKQATRKLGGRFATISTNDTDIDYLLQNRLLANAALTKTQRDFDVWDDRGHWIVLLLLPLAALGYRKGWLGSILAPLLILPGLGLYSPQASAFSWQDLWQTKDQQAQALLESGDSKQAAKTFQSPDWKGTSEYQTGDYAAAEKSFGQLEATDNALYNLGNAQARQNKLKEAIQSYEQALELNPDLEDAKSNLELVKQLQQQQKEQSDNQQQNEDEENKDQESEQDQEKQDQSQQQDGNDQSNESQKDQNQDSQSKSEQEQQKDQKEQQKEQEQKQSGEENKEETKQDEVTESEQKKPTDPAESQLSERSEDQDAMEQWLRRVPDDPGGLLRRKFQLESQSQNRVSNGDTTW